MADVEARPSEKRLATNEDRRKKKYIKIQFKPIHSSLDSLATTFKTQQHAWCGSTTAGFTRENMRKGMIFSLNRRQM
jgi:hypothetical protein